MGRSYKLGLACGFLFTILSANAARTETVSLEGTWLSDYGDVVLVPQDSGYSGTYGGEGHGLVTLRPGVSGEFEGFWFKKSSSRECDYPRDGTHYWGRLIMEAGKSDVRRLMKWGYCDDRNPASEWHLTREVRHLYAEGALVFQGERVQTRVVTLPGMLEFHGNTTGTKHLTIEDPLIFYGEAGNK